MAIPKPLIINFVQHSTLNWNKCSTQKDGVMDVSFGAVPADVLPHTQLANDMTSGISSKNFMFMNDNWCYYFCSLLRNVAAVMAMVGVKSWRLQDFGLHQTRSMKSFRITQKCDTWKLQSVPILPLRHSWITRMLKCVQLRPKKMCTTTNGKPSTWCMNGIWIVNGNIHPR